MRPLPVQLYEYAEWLKARANIDYHIEVKLHHYSVLFQLAKTQLDVCMSGSAVEALYKEQSVASDARSYQAGRHATTTEHSPSSPRSTLNGRHSV
jgi:hypothetical protein